MSFFLKKKSLYLVVNLLSLNFTCIGLKFDHPPDPLTHQAHQDPYFQDCLIFLLLL